MGWWRIDPETGYPAENAASSLSRPPVFVLLNAVPGVDDESGACYLGDGPSDMVSTIPAEVAGILGGPASWSAGEVRELFLSGRVPPGVGAELARKLRAAVDEFWADIDGCYEDDWDRPAGPVARRWICEELVSRLVREPGTAAGD
jgi:hypothetical protein